ncbi:hypothetical protein M011DRAFT_473619 [Sporormia fimetaria CBS 119925]|uniref:Large ribosomal subunit protein mL46 n=1 Tax=Sporormia fimetaria CBS 119925 TaxID=1340428 RepID=A0A6A6VPC8_9PLEO|nr:hypothetical protein M011DRAFT_473619 [Sporormia fimetaria CBS 119925]
MNAGQHTTRRLAGRAGRSICRSCKGAVPTNTYATAAAAVQAEESPAQHVPPVSAPAQSYAVNAGIVLSRPPVLTRDLHPFESAFFLYQRRLNERLALPFTRYFYFKKKTPADLEWKRKIKQRLTPARDIGRYKGYGDEAWNDELLVGSQESDFQHQVERLIEDAEQSGKEEEEEAAEGALTDPMALKVEREPVERPMPRVTEADLKGDVKSLNRLLPRTLYLLAKTKEGKWMFPQDKLEGKETLHHAAEKLVTKAGGENMNTWLVGHTPIGHYQYDYPTEVRSSSPNPSELGFKTFFLKVRIMAGQANLQGNPLGLTDFQWLAKEEVQQTVDSHYWRQIKNMLAER